MKLTWKSPPGFSRYYVSDDGAGVWDTEAERYVGISQNQYGSPIATIYGDDGRERAQSVSLVRLLALAFVGPRPQESQRAARIDLTLPPSARNVHWQIPKPKPGKSRGEHHHEVVFMDREAVPILRYALVHGAEAAARYSGAGRTTIRHWIEGRIRPELLAVVRGRS